MRLSFHLLITILGYKTLAAAEIPEYDITFYPRVHCAHNPEPLLRLTENRDCVRIPASNSLQFTLNQAARRNQYCELLLWASPRCEGPRQAASREQEGMCVANNMPKRIKSVALACLHIDDS